MARPRRRHYANKNHNCEGPSHVISVAVSVVRESKRTGKQMASDTLSLAAWSAIAVRRKGVQWYGRNESKGTTTSEFWQWTRERSRPREPIFLITHDAHLTFQLLELFKEIDEKRFNLTIPARPYIDDDGDPKVIAEWRGLFAVDDKPYIVYVVGAAGTIKIHDVRNYVDVSLPELSEAFDVGGIEASRLKPWEIKCPFDLQERARIVLDSTTRLMDAWRAEDRGNWQPTAARLAWGNYHHLYYEECPYVIDPILFEDKKHRQEQRKSYFGGEIQNWYRGYIDGHIFKDDISSSFPWIMANYDFPVDVEHWELDATGPPERISEAGATILVSGQGDLPCRKDTGEVYYPTGEFYTSLCGEELNWAYENKRIREWVSWTQYKCKPIFTKFIAYWWAVRRQAKAMNDTANDLLAKTMMNTLYGKFSSKRPQWTINTKYKPSQRWGYFAMPDEVSGKLKKWRAVGGVLQEYTGDEEKSDTFPAISAFVTSAQRTFMRNVRSSLPSRSVLAQSVDSLLLTEEGHNKLMQMDEWGPGELGKFRCDDVYSWLEIFGANHYKHPAGICAAGLAEINKPDGKNRWLTETISKSGTQLIGGPRNSVEVIQGEFRLNGSRTNKIYNLDGWAR